MSSEKHSMKPFYITTTLPYVNSDPHVGFAMEIIRADTIARYRRMAGQEVFFNTGTDEHGLKIYQKAFDFGEEPQEYVDRYVKRFKGLRETLGLSEDIHFIRTTDPHHVAAAREFWNRCNANGFIYTKKYKARYCVGCELERTDSEIENGRCFLHPHLELQIIEEENYFFRFSAFGEKLLDLYEKNPRFVIPDFRLNEIRMFVKRGLEDFSISRLKSKMPWGIEVPGDPDHVMYVWFDALVNYISTLGWPDTEGDFKKFWVEGETVQYAGKDNLRQQAAMWQAMLMAAGLPTTKQIVIEGFVTGAGGIKMSKSLGNTINPLDVVSEFGTDALRYYVSRELHPFEDGPFTMEKFKESYNANLANGLGNLTSRILKMAASNDIRLEVREGALFEPNPHLDAYDIKSYCDEIWKEIGALDKSIQKDEPFKAIKTDKKKGEAQIRALLGGLFGVARKLEPVMPSTSLTIQTLIRENKMPEKPLFARRD